MGSRLLVKNWKKFQHYKERRPPWIKLATDTFQNYEFSRLSDASKLLAICIWTLASRSEDGSLPGDFEYIKSQGCIYSATEENLQELIYHGFISYASNELATCPQNAMPETEGETEKRRVETEPSLPISEKELEMSAIRKAMSVTCLQTLGVRAEPEVWDTLWSDIYELVDAYGKNAVLDKFAEWAEENKGFVRDKPVTAFNKIAPGLLNGILTVGAREEDADLTNLTTTLYQIAEQAFVGKNRDYLSGLLRTYSVGEIVSAYAVFVSGKDANDLKYAPKNFCEGAAVDIIESRRALAKKSVEQAGLITDLTKEERAAAQAEIDALLAAEEAEAKLGEAL